jgi:hypothetical protein
MRPRTRIATLVAIAGASVLGTTSPALASDFALTMSGPSSTTVGQPTVFHIDGTNPPPSVYPFASWLDVSVISITATPTCPQDDSQATTLAPSTGGANIAFLLPEHADAGGHFTAVAGFTPIGAGTGLICAYTNDGAGNTLAMASLTLNILPAAPAGRVQPTPSPAPVPVPPPTTVPAPPASAPANVALPRLTRSGAIMRCSPGRWSGAVRSYAYRWLVDGRVRTRASAGRLRVDRSLRGHVLRCAVTATGPSGQSATATSAGVRG